jgi:hypothetical protein
MRASGGCGARVASGRGSARRCTSWRVVRRIAGELASRRRLESAGFGRRRPSSTHAMEFRSTSERRKRARCRCRARARAFWSRSRAPAAPGPPAVLAPRPPLDTTSVKMRCRSAKDARLDLHACAAVTALASPAGAAPLVDGRLAPLRSRWRRGLRNSCPGGRFRSRSAKWVGSDSVASAGEGGIDDAARSLATRALDARATTRKRASERQRRWSAGSQPTRASAAT